MRRELPFGRVPTLYETDRKYRPDRLGVFGEKNGDIEFAKSSPSSHAARKKLVARAPKKSGELLRQTAGALIRTSLALLGSALLGFGINRRRRRIP
jgi:hypothetical protein